MCFQKADSWRKDRWRKEKERRKKTEETTENGRKSQKREVKSRVQTLRKAVYVFCKLDYWRHYGREGMRREHLK